MHPFSKMERRELDYLEAVASRIPAARAAAEAPVVSPVAKATGPAGPGRVRAFAGGTFAGPEAGGRDVLERARAALAAEARALERLREDGDKGGDTP